MREADGRPTRPLFPSRHGGPLTRDAIERRLAKHVDAAQRGCPSLRTKRVSMHVLRHTTAMTLLGAGIDTSTIALWLGHEQECTTHVYLHADLALKQRTLDRITPPNTPAATARPTPCSPSSKVYSPPRLALGAGEASAHEHQGDVLAFRPKQLSRRRRARCLLGSGSGSGVTSGSCASRTHSAARQRRCSHPCRFQTSRGHVRAHTRSRATTRSTALGARSAATIVAPDERVHAKIRAERWTRARRGTKVRPSNT
jgi:hypothetical protein